MLTDFCNIWHTVYGVKFAIEQLLIFPPHLRTAATLPWKTSQVHNDNFVLSTTVKHQSCTV